MAVELRCPECRAKLRLSDDPEPGTDVECPKCANVFPAPDPDTGEVPDKRSKKKSADEDRPKKPADDGGEKKKKSSQKAKGGPNTTAPRKRRLKKKQANKTMLTLVIVGAVLFVSMISGLLIWYFMRKPASYEMMSYLPADTQYANGANIGHLQKYSELFKQVQNSYSSLGFYKAADRVAKASGKDINEWLDYVVSGSGKSGSALVLRTKKEFDMAALAKLPGAQEQTIDGQKVYIADHYRSGGGRVRVFAPTNRLIVFCDTAIPDDVFKKMLKGNKDSDKSFPVRAGPLGKRICRGTYWYLELYEGGDGRPQAPKTSDDGQSSGQGTEYKTQFASVAQAAKGFGFKASVGSREIRLELATSYSDTEAALAIYDKSYKNTDLAKGDEVEPPRWWKDMLSSQVGGDKKIDAQLLANLGAKHTGDLFILYSAVDTAVGMAPASSMITRYGGGGFGGGGPPPGMGTGPPGGGAQGPKGP